ncbi:KpsF/GutQ family sugar-phosphate isomerase [Collinsella tanakaei]|nr:KpsF/GutQ family sugar-phosphate isomerase [Collinsella tanakaei]
MDAKQIIKEGKRVFDVEIDALERVKDALGEVFVEILDEVLACEGKLVITGMGKPGHIAKKLAATFSSLGTPSFCLHPAEAMHGDLGMIDKKDVVIAISYSGESDEIVKILPNIKMIGAKLIAITGNGSSTLAQAAEIVQVFPSFNEACHLGLAPTSSTTVALVYGDALAVTASEARGFKDIDFGRFHPAGSLGKKLVLRVDDLMASGDKVPKVASGSLLMDAIKEITNKQIGVVSIVDDASRLIGIITDGDVRRLIEHREDIYSVTVDEVMTTNPKRVEQGTLAVHALEQIRRQKINCLPVVSGDRLIGTITWQQIVNAGIVL